MTELFRARCTQGTLVVTDDLIIIELGNGGSIRQQTMFRSSLTGVDSRMGVVSIFGMGGGTNLTFRSQSGEILRADLVKPSVAKEIVSALRKR